MSAFCYWRRADGGRLGLEAFNKAQAEFYRMTEHSFITLRKLTDESEEPVEHILRRVGEELRGFAGKATIRLRLIGVGKAGAKRAYSLRIAPEGASLQLETTADPDLEISTGAKTFRHITRGTYSPIQAYLDGRMYLRGNVDLGCVTEFSESYRSGL
jgi:hypothetical protein